ncbi:MAG TPA: TetR/AcrR family transcriptional regulator [Oligoflexus sp.]|uniref:TetR/AcrR family transcriptional regulator n=1 Tax=Oligoflexus sp. TaxID=1971216 RepID=UPI002D6D1DEB|nr:TetR/AcrR family transcriptional regulator [Oligoflexus sp.]HYX33258.1 TetR/AcrR family transcriptional regulator [Oligoflexus sp.]
MSLSRASIRSDGKMPKRRDRETTQENLLQAGLEVFSELGYDCATTKLIAQRAGSNEALISRYFQSKEGLLLAIIVRYINEKKDMQLTYPPRETLEEEFCSYLQTRVEQDIRFKDFIRIIVSRAATDPTLNDKIRHHVSYNPDLQLCERLKLLQKKDQLPTDADLHQICFVIGFQSFATVFMAHIIMGKDKDETLQCLQDFARVYARGLKQPLIH